MLAPLHLLSFLLPQIAVNKPKKSWKSCRSMRMPQQSSVAQLVDSLPAIKKLKMKLAFASHCTTCQTPRCTRFICPLKHSQQPIVPNDSKRHWMTLLIPSMHGCSLHLRKASVTNRGCLTGTMPQGIAQPSVDLLAQPPTRAPRPSI